MLANRMPPMKTAYINLALKQWSWLSKNILIDGIMQGDSLAGSSCTNNHAFLTYIEGVAISGLVALYHGTGRATYLSTAEAIATNTMSGAHGMINNGILFEFCDGDQSCNQDIAQFKGIFMRGLYNLWQTKHNAAGGKIPAFLQKNAASIWANARGGYNLLGMNWSGPFKVGNSQAIQLASHSSATMALVYAALVS